MRQWAIAALAALALLGAAAGAWWVTVGVPRANARAATETADGFLAAWSGQDWPAVAARVARDPATAAQTHREVADALRPTRATYSPERIAVDGTAATVEFSADLELEGMGEWTYTGSFALERAEGEWFVAWEPAVVHPALVEGARFDRTRQWLPRAPILSVHGEPLVAGTSIVVVGIEPQRISDREQAVRALVDAAGAREEAVNTLLDRPDLRGDWFYPVVELSREAFDAADDALRPVPGILFREDEGRDGPTVAPNVVGRAGPVTEEQLEGLGPPYLEGDVVGQSGLERALEPRLAGRPALEVRIVDPAGEVIEVVHRVEAVEPQAVPTTLDPALQQAAEQALEGAPAPAALVVVDVATGGLRGIANNPEAGFDRALAGRYPPGSTFKVVTSAALLGAGVGPDAVLECPGELAVGGRPFRNAGQLALGPITHRDAHARSCNTAYVGQTPVLGDGVLLEAARAFGFIDPPDTIPLAHFTASFPEPRDATELAAAAIGQARVEASPAHMASVAAAAASGVWRSPTLVQGDEHEERPIPGDPAALADMMRAVVASGTGTAAAVPGEPVAGKTGSAEFGTASPPQTHAWFIGFRGDVAFAVLVEGAGAGGAVAAPIAARFLRLLD